MRACVNCGLEGHTGSTCDKPDAPKIQSKIKAEKKLSRGLIAYLINTTPSRSTELDLPEPPFPAQPHQPAEIAALVAPAEDATQAEKLSYLMKQLEYQKKKHEYHEQLHKYSFARFEALERDIAEINRKFNSL